jgi:hypothetical protein
MNGMNGENGRDGVAVRYQLVGVTSTAFNGTQGVLTFNNACHTEFPGSRMCTSVEVMETAPYTGSSAFVPAYVRPVIVGQNSAGHTLEASGVSPISESLSLSCRGYTLSGPEVGLIVTSAGQFSQSDCSFERPVTCCAPVEPIP